VRVCRIKSARAVLEGDYRRNNILERPQSGIFCKYNNDRRNDFCTKRIKFDCSVPRLVLPSSLVVQLYAFLGLLPLGGDNLS
jgi:hypothetical protein